MVGSKNIINIYKDLYNLPQLTYKEKVDFNFFRVCKKNYNFVIISIYNEKREQLFLRDLNKNIGWELVGGYIKRYEALEDAVNRIVLKEVGLTIEELQPVAVLENNFKWKKRSILHRGVAFIALSRGQIKSSLQNLEAIYTKEIPRVMVYQDRKVAKIAKRIIENKSFEPPYGEIESGKKFFWKFLVNKHLIKLLARSASKKIKNRIIGLISNKPKSIIDVSCGDDDFIFKLEKLYNPEFCVANDISWKTLSLLKKKQKKSKVILTNHNVVELPFNKKFDLAIFKNTLHHIPRDEQINLIKKLSNLSKQLIIIDIENPYKSSFLAKLWHWYYIYFLGDRGGCFLTFQEFKENIKENIKDREYFFGSIKTIKGKYFYASLSEVEYSEEVEIKVKIEAGQIKQIKRKLLDLGAVFEKREKESDVYFTAPYRDFIRTKECLRIRQKGGYLELTYKGPTTKLMKKKKQFWKAEINIPLNCPKEEIRALLESIGFKKVTDVVKERERFRLKNQTIAFDNIEGLGWFLEIEQKAKNKLERERALEENRSLLNNIGLDGKDIITEPYRDIVLEKIRR